MYPERCRVGWRRLDFETYRICERGRSNKEDPPTLSVKIQKRRRPGRIRSFWPFLGSMNRIPGNFPEAVKFEGVIREDENWFMGLEFAI